MHYCQGCEQPVVLEPGAAAGSQSRCPRCGQAGEAWVTKPLFAVTGASGAGKSTLLAPLAASLAGRCVTFDADWLLDAAGALSGGQPINWTAFGSAWLAVAHGAAQSGLPTVLLGPTVPANLEAQPLRRWLGPIYYLLLDCPDDIRRRRMADRPTWRSHDIDEQVSFGRWLRDNIPARVDTSRGTPENVAAEVAAWVTGRLGDRETG